jgi:hypothetical protein
MLGNELVVTLEDLLYCPTKIASYCFFFLPQQFLVCLIVDFSQRLKRRLGESILIGTMGCYVEGSDEFCDGCQIREDGCMFEYEL